MLGISLSGSESPGFATNVKGTSPSTSTRTDASKDWYLFVFRWVGGRIRDVYRAGGLWKQRAFGSVRKPIPDSLPYTS